MDIDGNISTTDLFNLLKTKSQKSNCEILAKLQNFNNFPDFCNYYLNQDFYQNFRPLYNFISNFSNIDDTTSSLGTNIDKYISCLTKIILLFNLLLKTQEVLKKILISSKNELNSLKIKNQIENSNQENLFNLIDIFTNIFYIDFRSESSTSATKSNISSFDLSLFNSKNNSSEIEKLDINDEIYNELTNTPRFNQELKTIDEDKIENFRQNNKIVKKDSTFTLSGYVCDDEENNNIGNEIKQKENDNDKLLNLLVMINILYRKTLINAEEKIKLKTMVIDKSLKISKFYNDIYQNKYTN